MEQNEKTCDEYDGISCHYQRNTPAAKRLAWEYARQDEVAARLPRGANVLVVGCNDGRHVRRFINSGFRVTCVLDSDERLSEAKVTSKGATLLSVDRFLRMVDAEYYCVWVCCPDWLFPESRVGAAMLATLLPSTGVMAVLALHGSCLAEDGCKRETTPDEVKALLVKSGCKLMCSEEMPQDVCPNSCTVHYYKKA